MVLSPGTKLGFYEVAQAVGAGGMGEVYRATDTRLGRVVAIKILPQQLSSQDEFKQRFDREAQTIAGLNHPHICTLYDVGRHDGMDFLVMEFLEGETLATRLTKGPMPLEDALRVAIQVADALSKAHSLGVTHRDLKPGNIMLTPSGAKLMDFGLAKRALAAEGGSASVLPTAAADITQPGSILGTVQYMAPEQVEGEEAGPRSDIFALGVVLYEMVTGQRAFTGKSQASLMASILHHQPAPMSTRQSLTPPALQRVVDICMTKDPADRWQTAHDVSLQLKWIAEGGSGVGLPQPVAQHRKRREWLAWTVAALALIAAVALAVPYFLKTPAEVRVMRFPVFPNDGTLFGPETAGIRPFPAISPDGKRIAFQAQIPGEPAYLYVRSIDSLEAQRLPGTENALLPFWSPDNRYIGFAADSKLKRVEATGGPVQVICNTKAQVEASWGPDGTILFANTQGNAPYSNEGIQRVPSAGGTPSIVIAPSKDRKEVELRHPVFLPDGKHFLYVAQDPMVVWVGSLDPSEAPKRLLSTDSRAEYAPEGYLVFVQQGNLMAQKFDAKSLELSGSPLLVAAGIRTNVSNGRSAFSVSHDGTLVYRLGSIRGGGGNIIVSYDRDGKSTAIPNQTGDNRVPRLSPDGKHFVVQRQPITNETCDNCIDLWTVNLERGINTRITFGQGNARTGNWTVDGTRIIYAANPDGAFSLFSKFATGVGNEELLLKFEKQISIVSSVSRDNVLFTVVDPKTNSDVWVLPLSGDRTPRPFIDTPFNQTNAYFSPDGRWVAYQSDETGQAQVYVQPYPPNGQRFPISVEGGGQPRWRGDGKELFFVTPKRTMASVEIKVNGSILEAGKPRTLFTLPDSSNNNFDVTRDGDRFLLSSLPGISSQSDDNVPLIVVTHWTAGLKQ